MPRPDAVELAFRFRQELTRAEADAIERMGRVYTRLIRSLQNDIKVLADEIAGMDEISLPAVKRLSRLRRVLNEVADIGERFGVTVQAETDAIITASIDKGIADALQLVEASLPPLPDVLRGEIVGSLARVPEGAVESLVGLGIDDGVLQTKLGKALGDELAKQTAAHILDGVTRGLGSETIARKIAANVNGQLAKPMTWAARTVRTAQIKSYQISNHAQYLENERLVPEWVWVSMLDDKTCLSCLANHGKGFPVTETLRDHHNGRCVPAPKPISYKALGLNIPDPFDDFETGPEWFDRQADATKLKIMGPGKLELYEAGKVQFDEFVDEYTDDVYGELLREKTLKKLTDNVT